MSDNKYVWEKSGKLQGPTDIHNVKNSNSNKSPVRMSSNVTKYLLFDFFHVAMCSVTSYV